MKIDDNLPDHPKLWKMEKRRESALFLFIFALCYSSRNLTDGEVPCGVLESAARGGKQTCAAMIEAGLLEQKGSSYVVHDYLEWNRSKEEILAEREAARQRASRKKFARSSPEVRKPDTDTDTDREKPTPQTPQKPTVGKEDDLPKSTRQYLALHRVWERVIGSCPSEAVKRSLRAWGEMQYSEAAVEDALKKALANNARSPATYATAILRDGRKEEQEPAVDILKGAF